MFVVFEGIDGAGKSTVAKRVAEAVNGVYYKSPSPKLADASVAGPDGAVFLRRYVEELDDLPTRFMYYLFASAHDSVQISDLLANQHVVCDRYLLSTLAFHWAMRPSFKAMSVDVLQLLTPDVTFHLKVSQDEQARRVNSRSSDPEENSGWHDNNFPLLKKVEKEYEAFEVVPIDTTHASIEDVTRQCLRHLPVS